MKRKQFLYTAIGAANVASLGGCDHELPPGGNGEPPTIRWQMATSWSESLDTIYGGAQTLCDRVSKMTDGRFAITPYPAGALVPGLEVLDAVEKGKVECGHTVSYYYADKNPALSFASGVPFGLKPQQQNAWLYHGGGLEEIQKIYADFNVINFPAGNTGIQIGGWFKRLVNTVDDLRGLRMRIPGLGREVMARLGVEVVNLASNKIFQALKQGDIDAAEWIGPYDDLKLRLNEAAPFYYYPGWWEPGTTLDVLVNLNKWNQLPPVYQEIFKTAAFEANARMLAKYDALNRAALIELLSGGTKLIPYSDEIMEAARIEAFKLYETNAKIHQTFKQVYQKWKLFREQVYQWEDVIEQRFDKYIF